MKKIEVVPVGVVQNGLTQTGGVFSKDAESVIVLSNVLPVGAFDDLAFFSHLEIIFYFDLHGQPVNSAKENSLVKKNYGPNLFGTSIVKMIKKEGNNITVKGLDALHGTLVIDIKPVMSEFLPKEAVIQPEWTKKISGNY